jgi:hypothetical protein
MIQGGGMHAAALNHEVRNDAVEYGLREKFVLNILPKILAGDGCGFFKEFDDNVAVAGRYGNHRLPQSFMESRFVHQLHDLRLVGAALAANIIKGVGYIFLYRTEDQSAFDNSAQLISGGRIGL